MRLRSGILLLAIAIACILQAPDASLAQPPQPDLLAVPDPVGVTLDARTTAFLAIDFLESNCAPDPRCAASLPMAAAGLSAAREANALVVYATHLAPDNVILSQVAPQPGDRVFEAIPGGDKFFDSLLGTILQQAGTRTLVIIGMSSNSGVMYTAAGAIQRGYTVVVPEDGISGRSELATSVALWQLLNGPGNNPQNVPLQPRAVTLTRTDLITYE